MIALLNLQLPRPGVIKTSCIPLYLTSIVAGFLLMMMFLLVGCAGEETAGSELLAAPIGVSKILAWHPVEDASVKGYYVHYGQHSPGQPGSCAYESSKYVTSPSATIAHLDPDTLYYFTVSAYNGVESACSDEVSIVTHSI